MNDALRQLMELDFADKRRKHPTVPYLKPTRFSDKTANKLTTCVVRCFELHGHAVTRLASTGSYRSDLKRYVYSQQKRGYPAISANVRNRSVYVEVKINDRLSEVQKQTIARLENSGALVFVARDYSTFWAWFTAHFLPFDEGEHLPFGPVPSPDLFTPKKPIPVTGLAH